MTTRRRPERPNLLARASAAAGLAAERTELWVPGALASLAFLGWLPFIAAVVGLPTLGDLAFVAANLFTSPNFPLNVIVMGASVALGALSATILVAAAETLLLRTARRRGGGASVARSFDDDLTRAWGAMLVAALPALAAAVWVGLGIVAAAPAEYQSPDLGVPLILRLAIDIWPLLLVLVLAILAGQAYGAAAVRRAVGDARLGVGGFLVAGMRDLARQPLSLLGVAATAAVVEVAWLVGGWALLHGLWTPVGARLAARQLGDPSTAALLVAFIAIWLCLVAAGGAVHAWASTWWSLELDEPAEIVADAAREELPGS